MKEKYKVERHEIDSGFEDYIKPLVFGDLTKEPSRSPDDPPPTVVLLGGQLAAGKSTALKGISERHGRIVQISPDQFRPFHPHYDEIMQDDPLNMSRVTGPVMREWARMCEDHAYEHGISIVIEGTFISERKPLEIAERLSRHPESEEIAHQGFQTEVVALAVPAERSRIDMVGRYLRDPPGEGRWAGTDVHDLAFQKIPGTVAALERSPHVGRVIITDRTGGHLYDTERLAGGPAGAGHSAADALTQARSEGLIPFGSEESKEWLTAY